MNIKKRLFALMMALAMVLTYTPALAFADDGADTAVDDPLSVVLPVSAEPLAVDHIRGEVGTDIIKHSGYSGFRVTYSDESYIDFVYKKGTTKSPDGDVINYEGYYKDGVYSTEDMDFITVFPYADENFHLVLKEGWNKDVSLMVNAPFWDISTGKPVYTGSETLEVKVDIWCDSRTPVKVEFVPADGFTPVGFVGYNYITESLFYGEGNAFEVTYDYLSWDPETDTYGHTEITNPFEYVKTADGTEGFFEIGDPDFDQFEFASDIPEVWLNKGMNVVTIPYFDYASGSDEPVELSFKAKINANKYYAYANWIIFDYTGKNISKSAFAKKLVVRDSEDRVIPASEYTYTWKNQKKMGWYSVVINFKNKDKYDSPIEAYFGIGPKTPKVTKVKGGKKSLTVTWKKFTKAQLKNIDGALIEVAQNKNFTKGYKSFKVSKKALKKSNRKVLKKLAGKKKYFVRITTYKKIKQGESFYMFSNDSNVKVAKTKK
ncbi:MAG: hypothetical protein IJH43_06915 [Mogibacterium sp.]|nr:hypothetical protein [Mogibacterium sp.]